MAVRSTRGGSRAGRIAVQSIIAPKLQDSLGAFLCDRCRSLRARCRQIDRILLPSSMQEPLGSMQELTSHNTHAVTGSSEPLTCRLPTDRPNQWHVTRSKDIGIVYPKRSRKRCGKLLDSNSISDSFWPIRGRGRQGRGYAENLVA